MNFSRRNFLITASSLITASTIAACSSPMDPNNANTSNPSSGSEVSPDDETLIIYSNSVSDGRGDWLTEQAAAAGFKIQYLDLGGADVTNRLIAEKNNPIADVVFGLNNVFYERLKQENVLTNYTPAWSSEVDQNLGDSDGNFWPIVREPIMLVYSLEAYPDGAGAPTDWPDLWTKPEFENKYEVPSGLGGATTQMVISGILSRFRDDNSELGISDEGWENIAQYFAKGNPSVEGTDLFARMKNGDVNAGQMWLAGKSSREAEYDLKTRAVMPSIGVPMAVQHVALINGSKKQDQAKAFIDWFGAAQLQADWSKQFFTAPANESAAENANPDAVSETDKFKRQEIDWGFVSKNLPAWIEKIELEYLG